MQATTTTRFTSDPDALAAGFWIANELHSCAHATGCGESFFVPPARMTARPLALAQCVLPDLPTSVDLARWLDIHPVELQWLARCREPVHSDHHAYRWIPKRSTGWRLIEMPKASLRAIQRKLLHGLLAYVPPHEAAHGFRCGHSIITNAQAHVGQRVVLKMDLQDFFLTLRGSRMDALFRSLGYPDEVARTLTTLCTNRVSSDVLRPRDHGQYAGELPETDWIMRKRYASSHLPQGAPSSPGLVNLCAFRLDLRLQATADQFEANYTRYADDLSFSGDAELPRRIDRFIPLVGAIAMEGGLRVNFRKTRVMTSAGRQAVTAKISRCCASMALVMARSAVGVRARCSAQCRGWRPLGATLVVRLHLSRIGVTQFLLRPLRPRPRLDKPTTPVSSKVRLEGSGTTATCSAPSMMRVWALPPMPIRSIAVSPLKSAAPL
jgi:hypothetical protein